MNTSGVENNLAQAVKNLFAAWTETRAHWRDVKAREFEEQYLEPLPHHVARASILITEINALLRKVRSDCEQD